MGHGDFIQNLIDLLFFPLNKEVSQIQKHGLSG